MTTDIHSPHSSSFTPDRVYIATVLFASIIFLANIIIVFVVPRFAEMFARFGADLPFLTQMTMKFYGFVAVFALLGIVPMIKLFMNHCKEYEKNKKLFKLVVICFVVSLLEVLLIAFSLYLPIFRLGNVV